MSTESILADPALEALRKKLFPRVPWGAEGPVRRRYMARAEGRTVADALGELARREDFIAPEGRVVAGDGPVCLAAFCQRDRTDSLVLGLGTDVCWCDIALGTPDADGWQELVVRSEEGENLVALASARGAVRFRKI